MAVLPAALLSRAFPNKKGQRMCCNLQIPQQQISAETLEQVREDFHGTILLLLLA